MISIGQGQIIGSKSLNSFGYINDPSRMANLLLQSSFDNCVMTQHGSTEVTLGPVSEFPYCNMANLDGGASTITWMEDGTLQTPHSGAKCLGLRSGNILSNVRVEWQLTHLDGGGSYPSGTHGLNIPNDVYASVWLLLPSNWSIPPARPGYSPNWSELMNPFTLTDSNMNPKCTVHIHRDSSGVYDLTLEYDDTGGGSGGLSSKLWWVIFKPWDISTILGGWHKWSWFIRRSTDPNIAYVQMWLDNQLLGTFNDQNGTSLPGRTFTMRTKGASSTNWWIAFAKSYLNDAQNPGDGNYHYIYADDLQVWDGIP